MLVEFTNAQYYIQPGQTLSGKLAKAKTLQVSNGCLWLTIEGQRADIWLRPGQSITLPAKRLIVIEAYGSKSRFVLGNQMCAIAGVPGLLMQGSAAQDLLAA